MAVSPEELFTDIRVTVEAHFPIKELLFQDGRPVFTIIPCPDDKARFLRLRQALGDFGLLPLLRRRDGETVILLAPKPPPTRTRWALHVTLFCATLGTTFAAGYLNSGCVRGLVSPFMGGALFSFSLMAILVCHEMGHKLTSIWRGINSSLPYFIPFPPLPGPLYFGTMGAVILTQVPSPNRDALVELGASGPIAGFLVTVPILVYGIRHSLFIASSAFLAPAPGCEAGVFPTPLLWDLLTGWLLHPGSADLKMIIHPMAAAGWVGLLVTALNLLPASMLDGGHVTRAIFGPRAHRVLSYVAVGIGIALGYWFMSLLILILVRRGHPGPLDDCSPVTSVHKAVAVALVVIFALSAPRLVIF